MKKQLRAFIGEVLVFDRHGVAIHIGDKVRVKRCVGRYGQCVVEEGVVTKQSSKMGANICAYGSFQYMTNDGRYQQACLEMRNGIAVAHSIHDDFEHGHEKWAIVLEAE